MSKLDFFSKSLLQGAFVCAIVKRIFEVEGYITSYFGYESLFPALKGSISKKRTSTALKLRSTPDLMILNNSKDIFELVEVKSRTDHPAGKIGYYAFKSEKELKGISDLQKHWPECVITFVFPDDQMFYAQRAEKIRIRTFPDSGIKHIALRKDFEKFEEIFEIDERTLNDYKPLVRTVFRMFGAS